MNPILQLKQDRAAVATKASALLEKAATEKRALSPEETTQYDTMFAEINQYGETIKRHEAQASIDSSITQHREERQERTGVDVDVQREAYRIWLRGDFQALSEEQRGLMLPGNRNDHDFGRERAPLIQRAAQSALTGNIGGYLVPQGFYAQIQEAMKYYAGMLEAGCFELTTAMGNDLPIPTSNDTGTTGIILGESSPETSVEIPFSQVTMKAYKYSSRSILMPLELLQDAGVDIEAFIAKKLAERLGRVWNLHFTVGTGTSQPRGVTLDSVLGVTGNSSPAATAVTYSNLVDLKYSVNRAYRRNGKFMMNDTTLSSILKIVDSNGRPLILDYLAALQAGEPERILGCPIVVNNDLADLGAAAKSILFGDFSCYWIRRVMSILFIRLTERYMDAGQVGFLMFARADGRMVDAGTHPIKHFTDS